MKLPQKIFYNKKFLIYGMGKTGYSSYNYLKKNNQISLYDDNKKIFEKKGLKKFFLEKKKNIQSKI